MNDILSRPITQQMLVLLVLSAVVSCIAWTVTHEEILSEMHLYCTKRAKSDKRLLLRKLFYLLSCEYCFSHYVVAAFLFITRFKLLFLDWRGYLVALFALVWLSNFYMGLYSRLRLDIKHERVAIKAVEKKVEEKKVA